MDYEKEYAETLRQYQEKLGNLPGHLELDYSTVELIKMMERAIEQNRPLEEASEDDRGFICL